MLLKDSEAASFLGLKPITLRFWRMQKKGPEYIRMGRAVRYNQDDLQAFIETNKVVPEADHDHVHA